MAPPNLPLITSCVIRDGAVFALPEPGGRADEAYMWDELAFTMYVGKVKHFHTVTWPTTHSFGCPALFKPDIVEVASQIPRVRMPCFVTTEPSEVLFTDGNKRHRGVTTVLTPVWWRAWLIRRRARRGCGQA